MANQCVLKLEAKSQTCVHRVTVPETHRKAMIFRGRMPHFDMLSSGHQPRYLEPSNQTANSKNPVVIFFHYNLDETILINDRAKIQQTTTTAFTEGLFPSSDS